MRKRRMIMKRKTRSILATRFHADILVGLSFDHEYGGDMFLRNIGLLSTNCTRCVPEDSKVNCKVVPVLI
jgi:hypothetical protein